MLEKFHFFWLLIANYLALGFLIAILAKTMLGLLKVNAATRYSIWISALFLLVLLPLQSFFAPQPLLPDFDEKSELTSSNIFPEIASTPGTSIEEPGQLRSTSPNQPALPGTPEVEVSQAIWHWDTLQTNFKLFVSSELFHWASVFSILLLSLGIVFRLVESIESYRKLRSLIGSSEFVSGEPCEQLAKLADSINLKSVPQLKHNNQITTPLAAGVLRPAILVPSVLVLPGTSKTSLNQILLHELAHIKRRDTGFVLFQVLISIFLFWHPAVSYINRKINFERELACDDWVVSHLENEKSDLSKNYAHTLLELSQAHLDAELNMHSLACLRSTYGLESRIRILLDSSLNHTPSTSRKPWVFTLSLLLLLSLVWAPVWPQFPFQRPIVAESIVVEPISIQNPSILRETASIPAPGLSESSSTNEQSDSSNASTAEIPIKPITEQLLATSSAIVAEPLENQAFPDEPGIQVSTNALEPIELIQFSSEQAFIPVQQESQYREDPLDREVEIPGETASSNTSNTPESAEALRLSIDDSGELTIRTASTIEEITVTARRSLFSLRSGIRRAEKALYATYNEFNEIEEFEFHCRKNEFYEDLRRSHHCWPRFFEDIVAADAQGMANSGNLGPRVITGGRANTHFATTPLSTLRARHRSTFESLKNNILEIATQQPAVYDSMVELARLEFAYKVRREECMAKPPVLFIFRRCS